MSVRGRPVAALLVAALLVSSGCGGGLLGRRWGARASFEGFAPGRTTDPGFERLLPLTEIFYDRVVARRFNSKATYDDPALREFFRTRESFSDYYASFAEALDSNNFESHRPTSVRLRAIRRTEVSQVEVLVHFRGENAKPLRWWSTGLDRSDIWEYRDGRWWIIPGKV